MAYTIHYDFSENFENFQNLTWDLVACDDDKLIETEEFEYFYEDNNFDDKLEALEEFKQSDAYFELSESYFPIYNYVHILKYKPDDEQIELLSKLVGNVVIVYIEELEVYGIALTTVGMDLSDHIELAYYIIDGVSPVKAGQIDLSDKELLKYCRDVIKKEGWISLNKIQKFIEG